MKYLKNQSFIKGAVILIAANAISKILGAIFKIPLTYIMHEEGMGIFNSAFTVYIMGLSFVTAGFPVSVAKEISSDISLGKIKNTVEVTKAASVILTMLGIIGGCILFFEAHFFAYAIKEPLAEYAIKAAAPSIPAVALGTVYKAYFQGSGNMTPTAISQVTESIIRLILGILLAYYFSKTAYECAAAALSAITIGEFLATALLWALYEKNKLYRGRAHAGSKTYKLLFASAFPLMLASLLSGMLSVVEVSVIRRSLESITFLPDQAEAVFSAFGNTLRSYINGLKMTAEGANWLYGSYTGYAVTLFHLPTGIIATFCTSIFPHISAAYAASDFERARKKVFQGLCTMLFLSIPSAVLLFYLSDELTMLLFKSTASASLLRILAFSVVPMSVTGMCVNCLYAAGNTYSPLIFSFAGSILKILLCKVLSSNPAIHIYGVPIAAFFDFMLIMLLNLTAVYKKYRFQNIIKRLVLFALGGMLMALWCIMMYPLSVHYSVLIRIVFIGIPASIIYLIWVYITGAIKF